MTWPKRGLIVLLVAEGLGSVFVAILNLATSRALGHSVMPWGWTLVPGLFGVLALTAALGIWRDRGWAVIAAGAVQSVVAVAGGTGLVASGDPVLWWAVVMGVAGLLCVWLVSRQLGRTPA